MSHASLIKNSLLNLVPLTGKAGLITVSTTAIGYAGMTGLSGTGSVTIADSCTHVQIVVEGANARERADGTSPTTTEGVKRADGYEEVIHVNDFKARKWIRDDSTDVKVWVQQLTTA